MYSQFMMHGQKNINLEICLRNMRNVLWTGQVLCRNPCSRIYSYYEVVRSDVLIRSQHKREVLFVKYYILLLMYLPATLRSE